MRREPSAHLSRRALLRGLGAAGAVGLLAACGRDRGGSGADGPREASGSVGDVRQQIHDRLRLQQPLDLALVVPQSEYIAGVVNHYFFGLATQQREFLDLEPDRLQVVRDEGLSVVGEPVEVTRYESFGQLPVYGADLTVDRPGNYWIVVTTADHAAMGAVQVVADDESPVPQRGAPFPRAETPTVDDPMGLQQLCTREPPCTMHDVSLAGALQAGRPIVLTVATPEFCQTAICGPVVDVIQGVKEQAGRDDVAWIHQEVYSDAGNTPVPLMAELQLRSEPWTFFVAADGSLADKIEGPTPAPVVAAIVAQL